MYLPRAILNAMVTDARGSAKTLALTLFKKFFEDELSYSSWDGQRSNANGDIDVEPAPGLDPFRRDAIAGNITLQTLL